MDCPCSDQREMITYRRFSFGANIQNEEPKVAHYYATFGSFRNMDEITLKHRHHFAQNETFIFVVYIEKYSSFLRMFTFLEKMLKYKQKEGDNNV